MKIGLFFGSFNPVHVGHLIIANHILNETEIKKIWFIVSPQNPFKAETNLLNEYHRLHFLQLATDGDKRVKVSNIEFNLPRPSYTASTLAYVSEKHPGHEFVIIMGSDSFQNLFKWKNVETIIENHSIYVYKRREFKIENKLNAKIYIVEAPLLEISATQIRKNIKQGKSVRYMVPDRVLEEIEKGNYYRK
ncbi:MAG TPA: nicotinate (nicotinamide) nucleotide adenylyltransferase [Chitinophagaceae bacterium]|nr:nicotinate (nicotinamide) nucleotide adenylyltransferase [Chitinophagaceae bacterium]